ncbi:MAG: CHAT domain-containing protein [Scytonema sp. PMC 1069.18]|nr:CHAT domain-containing protein [Scytonema sp. PMC 1069.18]MEC4884863.1 CHAT domain-containing protein [Scytonema sp. PMC 1070.18]
MTQEFHISVTPVGLNDYLVRTEQVAPGVPLAEELVSWPVADWLTAAGHVMNDPLKTVLQGDAIARNSVNLVALGQQLYNALFQGTLRDSWITAQGIAQNHQQVLRLRLGLKDTRLARLPWEVMHAGDRPVATGPYIAFSRYQSGMGGASRLPSTSMPRLVQEDGINVLMVIASPTDLVRLDLLKQEAIKLQAELHRNTEGRSDRPQIELTLLEQPGREELTQALEQGRYHVLHYSGHSNLGPNGGEIYLVSNRTGLKESLSGDDLAGLLVNNNIQMAVFNSCLGAYGATGDKVIDSGERNLTESLVKRGIKGVLAMSERIPDEVALMLTQLFYRNLSLGLPVDVCVSRMRQGLIAAYSSHQLYWALPILYLQKEFNGYLSPEAHTPSDEELLDEYDTTISTTTPVYSETATDAEMALPIDDMIPSAITRSDFSELDWLGDDTWGDLVDEIEYDDPSYAEDSAIVSDLFRQLDRQKAESEQSSMTAELIQDFSQDNIEDAEVSGEIASLESDIGMWEEVKAAAHSRTPGANRRELPGVGETPPEASRNLQDEGWDNLTLPPSDPAPVNPTRKPQPRQGRKRNLPTTVGIVAASAIAAIAGFSWWTQNQQPSKQPDPAIISSQPDLNTPVFNIRTEATGLVTAYAADKLSKGELQAGLVAVEELLDRGALTNAQTALNLVPERLANDPSVNFARGRLAWQSAQTGDTKYTIDDARRYWELAVKANPDSLLYRNALGFAYYAQEKLDLANDSWFKALNVAVEEEKTSDSPFDKPPVKPIPRDALTTYAGLALGLYKTSNGQPTAKQDQYISEALKLRQMILRDDPVYFEGEELRKNWLWTDKAIQDWQRFLQIQQKQR